MRGVTAPIDKNDSSVPCGVLMKTSRRHSGYQINSEKEELLKIHNNDRQLRRNDGSQVLSGHDCVGSELCANYMRTYVQCESYSPTPTEALSLTMIGRLRIFLHSL